jgi:hypothetical protein
MRGIFPKNTHISKEVGLGVMMSSFLDLPVSLQQIIASRATPTLRKLKLPYLSEDVLDMERLSVFSSLQELGLQLEEGKVQGIEHIAALCGLTRLELKVWRFLGNNQQRIQPCDVSQFIAKCHYLVEAVLSGFDDFRGADMSVFCALPSTIKRLRIRTVVPVREFPTVAMNCAQKLPNLERLVINAPVRSGVHDLFGVGLKRSREHHWEDGLHKFIGMGM